jgi:hypothetical protein
MKTKLIIGLIILSFNCFAQKDLRFSNAFFINLSSGKVSNFIATDTTIIIPEGKIWEITSARVYMTYDNRIIDDKTSLYLNNQIIANTKSQYAQNTNPIWLPAGKYKLLLKTEEKSQEDGRFKYISFISGIEYDASNK